MGTKHVTRLDVEMKLEVNTEESCSRMLQTIIQVLLFQRSQIPFCYEVFKTIVNKLKVDMTAEDPLKWANYQLEKQRDLAIEMLHNIQILFKKLTEIVRHSEHDIQAMLLFGSTLYTVKEAFIINIPIVDRKHYPQNHRQGLDAAMKLLTRQIILSEDLRPSGRLVGPTNIFMVLGMPLLHETEGLSRNCEYNLIEDYQLPINCLKYLINVNIRREGCEGLACCKQMDVFNDSLQCLKIDDSGNNCGEILKTAGDLTKRDTMWYQIGKAFKGYNDVTIKGKSIWNAGL
ncbi:uncharacterized protein LOC134226022 [Armigeres subalbatus]|uniref:uncharacterized protein LOC134226022 n=1 Tax=Armigeres subalbatus TaxID=124917 RepID=UPI002ED61263